MTIDELQEFVRAGDVSANVLRQVLKLQRKSLRQLAKENPELTIRTSKKGNNDR